MVVRLGEYNRSAVEAPERQDLDVDQTFPHPNFTKFGKDNDIGLIQMVRSVQFTQYVRPACLSNTYDASTVRAVLTGWGRTSYRGEFTKILTKVPVLLQSYVECQQYYKNEYKTPQLGDDIIEGKQICARATNENACQVRKSVKFYSNVQETAIITSMRNFCRDSEALHCK